MVTSGTVGQTTIPVIDIIDHSILRCGISPAKIEAENLLIARRNLFYYIMYLANKGVNLWTIERKLIGLNKFQAAYDLAVGTIDVLNMNYRTISVLTGQPASSAGGVVVNAFDRDVSTYCQQASPNGNISLSLFETTVVTDVGFMPFGNLTLNLIWEYSIDNVVWTSLLTNPSTTMTDGTWYWYSIAAPKEAKYFRVRELSGGVIGAREVVFANNPTEIPVQRNNRDDYVSMPNKSQLSEFPTQFWYNRIIPQPQVILWPTPQNTFVSLVVWQHRQIQDIGDLTNEIEVPQRWYECILANLAARNALDIPDVEQWRIQMLGQMATNSEEPPYDEERDKSPMFFTPNIGNYTGSRGVSYR